MNSRQKKFFLILIFVTLVALCLRLVAGWQMLQEVPGVTNPISATDMETYIKYGKQFKNGTYTDFEGAYYYQPFYYAVYLNCLFRVFGENVSAIVISQAILGALTVLLTGLVGALLGGRKVGICGAVILALFRNHILYTPYALIAILQTFLITLVIYLLILAFKKGNNRYWLFAGLTAACSILCRGNFLLIIPFIVLLIFYKYRRYLKQALLKCALFVIMVYLPQLPFSIKNYQVTGKWTGPSIAGGIVLAIGNNPDAAPGTIDVEGSHYFHFDSNDEYTFWMQQKESVDMKESVKSWISEYPMQWVELKLRTLLLYLSNEECYNNITLQANAKYVNWLISIFLLDYWIVGIPFIVFLVSSLKRLKRRSFQLIFLTSLIYIGSTVLFYVLSRYKLPIIPLMSVIAVIEVRRWRKVFFLDQESRCQLFLLIQLLFSTFVVCRLFSFYQENFESVAQKWAREQGNFFETPEAWYLKDHNNSLRGGWEGQILTPQVWLSKQFSSGISSTGSKGQLRFFAGIESMQRESIKVSLKHNNRIYSKTLLFNSGWIELDILDIDSSKKFELNIQSLAAVGVFYTPQRNYQRSTLNEKLLDGEWIMQLKVFKEK